MSFFDSINCEFGKKGDLMNREFGKKGNSMNCDSADFYVTIKRKK